MKKLIYLWTINKKYIDKCTTRFIALKSNDMDIATFNIYQEDESFKIFSYHKNVPKFIKV